ncbi:MAG: BatD family protein [Panacagrimonas sp.]
MNRPASWTFFLLLGCCLVLSRPVFAAVTASLDHDRVEQGETVQLVLQREGRSGEKPDLSPLARDFDVLGTQSGSSIRMVNGDISMQRQMTLTLAPKRAGKLQIPSLEWNGERSPALELVVGPGGGGADDSTEGGQAAAGSSPVFLTTSLDITEPYVQAAVVLTVRLYLGQALAQASLDLPATDDLLVQQLGKDRQTRETRNGRAYEVIERKYLLLPQRSGTLKLDGPVFDAQVQDDRQSQLDPFFGGAFGNLMGRTRPLRLRGDEIVLDVQPRPANATGRDWLPARKVALQESWKSDGGGVRVGEPLTRHLTLSAEGVTAEGLPDLSSLMPMPDGLRAYPDQPKLDNGLRDDQLVGSREQDVAIIAARPGRYQLPELRLAWWDTAADVQREAVLPARTLDILPAVAGAGGEPSPAPVPAARVEESEKPAAGSSAVPAAPSVAAVSTAVLPWPWISLALGLLWLGTMAAWWGFGRRSPPVAKAVTSAAQTSAATALKAFREACRKHDARAARQQLLAWARTSWPDHPPTGLGALALRLDDPEAGKLLPQLDRACYADGPWDGEALASLRLSVAPKAGDKAPMLAGLYP